MGSLLGKGLPRGLALALLVVLAGCAAERKPDLARLYQGWAIQSEGRRPVIVIPGMLGTRLKDPSLGQIIWGTMKGFLGGDVASKLALNIDSAEPNRLETAGLVEEVGGVDIYGGILKVLEQMGGYAPECPDTPNRRATYFVFPYDWRHSSATNAAGLEREIQRIKALYGDPNLQVDIVAHSMGGLIVRYYLLYGARDVRGEAHPEPDFAGAQNVNTVVLLGTPSLGSVAALHACIEGNRVGLTPMPPEVLATLPSMYELMPSPSVPVLYGADGHPVAMDLYDVRSWRRMEWGIFDPQLAAGIRSRYALHHPAAGVDDGDRYLERLRKTFGSLLQQASGFHRALEAAAIPGGVKIVLMGGDCTPTPRAFLVERDGDREVVRFSPDRVKHPPKGADLWQLYFEPGDGTVTKSSLMGAISRPKGHGGEVLTLFPYASPIFLCERHTKLVRNPTFQDNLLQALLFEPISPGEACRLPTVQSH